MATPLNILIVEDSQDDADLMMAELRRAGFAPRWKRVETEPDFLAELEKRPDIILSDYSMPQFNGLRASELLQKSGLNIPFILISGTVGEEVAVEAMRHGATDYLLKDRIARLGVSVERALEQKRLCDERRRTEAMLREHEADLAEAQRIARLGSWRYDIAGNKVRWSDELCRIFGIEKTRFGGNYEAYLNCVFPDDRPKVRQANADASAHGTSFEVEYRIQTPAGDLKTIRETGYALKDAGGRVVGLFGTAQDITEHKRAEEALRESEAKYRKIFENVQDVFYQTDHHGKIIEISPSIERYSGYRRTELIGKPVEEAYYNPEDRARLMKILLEKGEVVDYELRLKTKTGRLVYTSLNAHILIDSDGQPSGVEGALRDITERKQIEDALRESEAKFRQIAETITEAFWVTDPARSQLLYISPAYEKIWGRTCESLYQSPESWVEAVHPEDRERVLHAAVTRQARGEYNETYRITRPDGSVRWIQDRAFLVRNAAGEIYRIVGTAEDVTETRKLEAQIRQAQKMESVGQLAGGIAHDFNNILAAIVGNLYLAKMAAANQPSVLEYLGNISKATERATDLVRQILTFSRRKETERTPVKLNHVVLEALKLLRASMPATIRIQTELAEIPPVLANATAIHQVIMNLGANAWHAMRDQPGTLKIEMHVLEVDADFVTGHPDLHPGSYVRMSVSDTGCGMDRATLERIFDPFFTTKPVGEGTGLGLSVVHGIMKSHDGGIYAYSQPGQGAVFHLYFPVIEAPEAGREIEPAPVPHGRGEHILFVDDEEILVNLGKSMLEGLGYTVTSKTSALDAVATLRDQPDAFDLAIIDLTMPVMDGFKLAGQLLQTQPRLPLILMTGYSGLLTAEKMREMGFRELMDKPYPVRILAETVHRVLLQSASDSPAK